MTGDDSLLMMFTGEDERRDERVEVVEHDPVVLGLLSGRGTLGRAG